MFNVGIHSQRSSTALNVCLCCFSSSERLRVRLRCRNRGIAIGHAKATCGRIFMGASSNGVRAEPGLCKLLLSLTTSVPANPLTGGDCQISGSKQCSHCHILCISCPSDPRIVTTLRILLHLYFLIASSVSSICILNVSHRNACSHRSSVCTHTRFS